MDDKELFKQIEKDFIMLDNDTIYNIDGIKFSLKFANHKNSLHHQSLFIYNGTSLYVNNIFLTPYMQKVIENNPDLIIFNVKKYLVNKYQISPSHSKYCELIFNYLEEIIAINIYKF